MKTLQTKEQRKKLDDLLGPIWREPRHWQNLLKEAEYVKNDPEDKRSKSLLAGWRHDFDTFDKEKQALLKELFETLNIRIERLSKRELLDSIFLQKISEWKEWKANDYEPEHKKFTDGTSMRVWETTARSNTTAKRHKKALKDAGVVLDKKEEKIKEAMNKIKRLKDHEDEHGNLNNLSTKEDERFVHAVKALYRKIQRGKAKPTQYSRKVFSEIDKQLKTFTWMPSKEVKIPNIYDYILFSEAGNKTTSHRFSATFNKECRNYTRKDLELLKEMRDKVMDAGHHIDFPKPAPHNKGQDNWKKKAEAKKEANKEYWEVHGWNDKKIQILKDNYKEFTDEELAKGLLKPHTSKAISAKRKELDLLKKRNDSEPIELRITITKPNKGNTRYNIYIGIDSSSHKKGVYFSSSNKKIAERALTFYQERVNDWAGTWLEFKDSFIYEKQRSREEVEARAQELGIPTITEPYGGKKGGRQVEIQSLVKKIEAVEGGIFEGWRYHKKRNREELVARAQELGIPTITKPYRKYLGGRPVPCDDLAQRINDAENSIIRLRSRGKQRNRKELEARALKLGVSITTDPYNGFSGGEPLGLKRLEERIKEAENK